ncbi:MAG: hypothetical protein ACRDP6_25360 [Actinoallomurus sp.]
MTPPAGIRRVIVLAFAAFLASVQSADAHVLIRPDCAPTETLTLFTVLSPDEKQVPLTGLRLTTDGSTKLWPNVLIAVAQARTASGSSTTTTHTEVFAALAVATIALIGSGSAVGIALRKRAVRPGDGDQPGRAPSAPGADASADRR